MDAIQKIESALAAGPTEGPWLFDVKHPLHDAPTVCADGTFPGGVFVACCSVDKDAMGVADAKFIAACNPAAIREVLQTLASKEAELVRLREALAWSEQFHRHPGEGYTECFERIGEVFYRKTGHLRPGKDASPESGVSMDERQAAWDAWIADGIAKMRAALKHPPE